MRLLVMLAVVGVAFGTPVPTDTSLHSNRIVGGVPTTVEKYPFMANMRRLTWSGAYSATCGGSLISRTSVVTAAHCTYGDPSINWRVRLGTSSRNEPGGTDHNLLRIINHEYYDRPLTLNNDLAVVILREPAVFSATVAPIKLAAKDYDLPDGAVVTTIGWGSLGGAEGFPTILQEVDVNVIPQTICEERYHALKEEPSYEAFPDITPFMICSGILDIGGKDSCGGDSGGPLIHEGVLVGIVSFGYGCAEPQFPGVNARVSALSEWIVLHSTT